MTFEDDFIRFHLPGGEDKDFRCRDLGIDWPPPPTLRLRGFEPPHRDITFTLLSVSKISDDDRANMTHVCRGAQYVVSGTH